jgi:hypothetical protein
MRLGAATARVSLQLGLRWRKRLTPMPSGRRRLSQLTAPNTRRSALRTELKATQLSSSSFQELPKEPSKYLKSGFSLFAFKTMTVINSILKGTKVHDQSKHLLTGSTASSLNNSMLQLLRKKRQPPLLLRREKSLFSPPPLSKTLSHRPNRLLSSSFSPLGVATARRWPRHG